MTKKKGTTKCNKVLSNVMLGLPNVRMKSSNVRKKKKKKKREPPNVTKEQSHMIWNYTM